MLGNKDAAANIAVKNLETARKFYEDTIGLKRLVHILGVEGSSVDVR